MDIQAILKELRVALCFSNYSQTPRLFAILVTEQRSINTEPRWQSGSG
jgi:hypothetical protein